MKTATTTPPPPQEIDADFILARARRVFWDLTAGDAAMARRLDPVAVEAITRGRHAEQGRAFAAGILKQLSPMPSSGEVGFILRRAILRGGT